MRDIISFIVGVLVALLLVAVVVGIQLWLKHRNDVPECIKGQPITQKGCVTTYPLYYSNK